MTSKFLAFACATLISTVTACSDNSDEIKTPAYMTNAEYVLERLVTGNSTAVAFHVKPHNPAACEHMFLRLGKKDAAGEWQTTNEVYPGKDKRDNFGQYQLSNQIHFAEIDNQGEFGILALGCKPRDGNLRAIQGLMANFEIQPGKLNYIGEIATISVGRKNLGLFRIDVADRTDFAMKTIQSQLPDLAQYFETNVAIKFEEELSPNLKAVLEELKRKQDNRRLLINARTEFNETVAQAHLKKAHWERANGTDRNRHTDQQTAERRSLNDNLGRLQYRLSRFDDWISRNIDFAIIQEYLALEKSWQRARKNLDDKFPPLPLGQILTGEVSSSPERRQLQDESTAARRAFIAFEEKHGL